MGWTCTWAEEGAAGHETVVGLHGVVASTSPLDKKESVGRLESVNLGSRTEGVGASHVTFVGLLCSICAPFGFISELQGVNSTIVFQDAVLFSVLKACDPPAPQSHNA